MKQTFLDKTHISTFQSSFNQFFPDKWSWSPDGEWCFWICEWASLGLGQPDSASTASPSPAQVTSRPKSWSGWLGSRQHKTFSVFLTTFSLILVMFWQLWGLFFNLLSTCLMLQATGETPKPRRTSRNAKHLQWVTAAEVPARTIPDLERERGRRGQFQQLQSLCRRLNPGKMSSATDLEWG